MRCPTVKDLAPPPKGKTGWPWTEESPQLPPAMPDGSTWPRLSIITPSYNQGHFLEETIRSLLLQGYPDMEYIIIDGNSTDNSVEIVKKYENYITFFISEPDRGYGDAVNKGYRRCTGQIFTWIAADDCYAPGCFKDVVELYHQGYQLIVGECLNIKIGKDHTAVTEEHKHSSIPQTFDQYAKWWSHKYIPQPAAFIAKNFSDKAMPLDNRIPADFGFFLRVTRQDPRAIWAPRVWVKAKYHGKNLSAGPQRFRNYLQSDEVAIEETAKVYGFRKRLIFFIQSKDNLAFSRFLLENSERYTIIQLLKQALSWPFIIRRPIFLKAILETLIGNEKYLQLKKLIKRF